MGSRDLAVWALLALTAMPPVIPAFAQTRRPSSEAWFDIPAQPIAAALDLYSAQTGIVAAYNGELANGRSSSKLQGHFTAEAALKRLLAGSGLRANYTTGSAFVLVPAPETAEIRTPTGIAQAFLPLQRPAVQRYSGLVQSKVTSALCAQPETRPGDYRLAASFWIDVAGRPSRVKLLDTTGDPHRDDLVEAAFRELSIGEAPPPNIAQPFTIVVLPRSSGGTADCAGHAGGKPRD